MRFLLFRGELIGKLTKLARGIMFGDVLMASMRHQIASIQPTCVKELVHHEKNEGLFAQPGARFCHGVLLETVVRARQNLGSNPSFWLTGFDVKTFGVRIKQI